jgi:hypothetical protein
MLVTLRRPSGGRSQRSARHSASENQISWSGHAFFDRSLAGRNFFTSAWIFFMLFLSRVRASQSEGASTDIEFGIPVQKSDVPYDNSGQAKKQQALMRSSRRRAHFVTGLT